MIFGELLVLMSIIAGGGLAALGLITKHKNTARFEERYRADLKKAMTSSSYSDLDVFLVTYDKRISSTVREVVQMKRNELYNEKNP